MIPGYAQYCAAKSVISKARAAGKKVVHLANITLRFLNKHKVELLIAAGLAAGLAITIEIDWAAGLVWVSAVAVARLGVAGMLALRECIQRVADHWDEIEALDDPWQQLALAAEICASAF